MSFIDTTPMGRIIARFSNDIEVIDVKIGFLFSDTYYFACEVRLCGGLGMHDIMAYCLAFHPMFVIISIRLEIVNSANFFKE